MNGGEALYNALNVSAITGLLSVASSSYTGNGIENSIREPDSWAVGDTVITFYRDGPMLDETEKLDAEYVTMCRAPSQSSVEALADAVFNELHRTSINGNEGRFYCNTGGVVQPESGAAPFRLPVTVRIKSKRGLF